MNSYVITPKSQAEQKELNRFLASAHLAAKVLSDDEKEEIGLMLMMSDVDPNDTVSEEDIRNLRAE